MKLFFGSLVAVVLLALHVYTIGVAVSVAGCVAAAGCQPTDFTPALAATMSLTGGLVSALVIAELAVTDPGTPPFKRALSQGASAGRVKLVTAVAAIYLVAWLLGGLWAFVVGYLRHPGVVQPLTDLGQAWLGLAVAAGYSYFGIKRG
ncbi:MAG TPA: hypothetical protein VLS93_03385 [Anaeromyxobacteraceae bacterium]|nr:hypothetical protein [Anaeromyxobacteraceae bacterium]